MKKLIVVVLIGYAAWHYYSGSAPGIRQPAGDAKPVSMPYSEPATEQRSNNFNNFSCDGRVYCSQMRSRAEAEFFINNCPNTKMDGDHDGIPCENDSRF